MSRFQLERIFVIDSLIRDHQYPSADALAQQLEVSRRVIYNDRKFLVERLGAPLQFDRARRGWFYSERTWTLPATMVTQGELRAFFLSVEVARRNLGGALETSLRAAVDKISRTLPGEIEVELDRLASHFSFAAPSSTSADENTLMALAEAIRAQRVIEMRYYAASTGQRAQRIVHPHHLHHTHGDWYLLAFDLSRNAMRTYNVGRIEHLQTLSQTFVRQADFDSAAWNRHAFVTEMTGAPEEVVIRFDEYQSRYVRERRFHQTQMLEDQPDGGVILRLQSSGLGEIKRWVLSYGAHAEVLSPPELRCAVQAEIERMTRVYEDEL